MPSPNPPTIRSVWAHNLDSEFALIRRSLYRRPIVAIDTEFPGTIHLPLCHPRLLSPADRYALVKSNVDSLHLIQLGLTLYDNSGKSSPLVWEFNFREFNPQLHRHSPESVALLRSHGIDFEKNRARGIDSKRFAELFLASGLVCNGSAVSWVTFHSCYDFGYLVKVLSCRRLPEKLGDFLGLVRVLFGERVFDMKFMMRFCDGLYGGLDKVAGSLLVERAVGRCHQAGSDSLVTLQAFWRMKEVFFVGDEEEKHAGVIYGLQVC